MTAVEAACPWDNQKLSRIRYGGPTGLTDGPLFPVDRGWDPLWVAAPFGVGDLDGDGFGEMVGLKRYGAYLVRGCGGAPPTRVEPHAVKCGSCQAASAQAGDFDGDGVTDLLYLSTDGATVMFGDTAATRTTEFHVAPVAWVLDYNYDGFSDFIAETSSGTTGQLSGWLGGPDGLTADPAPGALPPLPSGHWLSAISTETAPGTASMAAASRTAAHKARRRPRPAPLPPRRFTSWTSTATTSTTSRSTAPGTSDRRRD